MMRSLRADRAVLLTPTQMAKADALTIAAGTSGLRLMERAGEAVVRVMRDRYPRARHIAILAGPGNNGGDAFVAAACLFEAGLDPIVYAEKPIEDLKGDAALAAETYAGSIRPLTQFDGHDCDVILDGLYGAGLSRPIEGSAAQAIGAANRSGRPIIAIDLPSGVSGLAGTAQAFTIQAACTVTFFRRKPGHVLQPGRARCGEVITVDIGIDASVLDEIGARTFVNDPDLWTGSVPRPSETGHKFDRGHAVVFSGSATTTGAARLSAAAALRIGAGLVTMASPDAALSVNASHLTAVMLRRCEIPDDLDDLVADQRLNAFVLGPGFGIGPAARAAATAVLRAKRRLVLDADGLSSFADAPDDLFDLSHGKGARIVLTPHGGEFARLFPDLAADGGLSKLDRARRASERSGAVIVLKGADTVIAEPVGRAAINEMGTPYLATAGSGDVLSGLIGGLLAQGMPPFEAAAAAVWIHGRAAKNFGPGLIAEDLPNLVPRVLAELLGERG